jgi:hypothetical protein
MTEQSKLRRTVESLSGLIISGRLFELDHESVTVDADGVHYEVLLEYVVNAAELASAKQGDTVDVRLSPTAKIVEKRLIDLDVPGMITDDALIARDVIANCECSRCSTACSRCVSSECSNCNPPVVYQAPRFGFRRFFRR